MTPTGPRRSSSSSPLSRTRRPATRSSAGSSARARTCRAMPARRISSSRSRSTPPADRVFWACSRSSLLAVRSAAASEVRRLAMAPRASAIWLSVARAMSPVAPPAALAASSTRRYASAVTTRPSRLGKDPDVVGQVGAERGTRPLDAERQGAVGADAGHLDHRPRHQLLLLEVGEHAGHELDVLGQEAEPPPLPDPELGKGHELAAVVGRLEAGAPDQRGRHRPALGAEGDLPVGDGHEPFLREAADLLRHGGGRHAEPLGDPGLGDPAALLLHLVDGLEVFLG